MTTARSNTPSANNATMTVFVADAVAHRPSRAHMDEMAEDSTVLLDVSDMSAS